jgi:hypothetical protein
VSSQVGAGQAGSIFGRLVKLDLTVAATKGQIARAIYQPQNKVFLQNFTDGALLVWDFEQGAQIDEFRLPAAAVPVFYDVAERRIIVLDNMRLLGVSHATAGASTTVPLIAESIQSAASSGDGRSLFLGTPTGEVVKLLLTGKIEWRTKPLTAGILQVIANRDGTRITVLGAGGEASVLDGAGSTTSKLSGIARLGNYDSSGRQVHILLTGEALAISAQGAVSNSRIGIDGKAQSISLNERGDRRLTISSQGELSVGNDSKWGKVDADVKEAMFLGDKRYLSIKKDGVTYLRSLDLDHYLVAIVPGTTGWVIVDHEGRYDGTVDGTNDVKWNSGGGALNLDQFFESYYQPGLLAEYVNERETKKLGTVPGKLDQGVFLPPKLELDFPDGKMKPGSSYKVVAIAESKGGDLAEGIRVFHNGKRLPEKARIGSQKVQKDGRLLLVQVFAFVPEGGANEVFAEVRNTHGITGRSEVKREITDGFRSPGKLHLLGLGIDRYQLSKIDLDFATIDVKTIVSKVSAGAGKRFEQVVPHLVLDANATRAGIMGALEALGKLDPQDSLVLVLAGHGDVVNDEWYFIPHDVNLENIPKTAISARELQDALVNSPVRRIFLMVDACYSGAEIDSFNKYRGFQRRIAQQVGRNTGVSVLTATRRDQTAAELTDLGHGLFTHVVLEGLAGAADTSPSDRKISAHELANFVGRNLEDKARPFFKRDRLNQSPAHFVIGSDFLILDVAN